MWKVFKTVYMKFVWILFTRDTHWETVPAGSACDCD